jgi:hypothetical protein
MPAVINDRHGSVETTCLSWRAACGGRRPRQPELAHVVRDHLGWSRDGEAHDTIVVGLRLLHAKALPPAVIAPRIAWTRRSRSIIVGP